MTAVGDVLASKYRLEELLGSGGMGHVFRATNELVGRAVAIKVLRSEHATSAPLVERFLREARAANLVRHPNVVDVLDIGRDGDGSPFIVQELLKGQDLAKYVEKRGGKLDLEEIESYFLPVADAVAEAHARGVVHRDIKPENVFLAEEGQRRVPKLLDFGISKIRMPDIRATEVGVLMGTPAYMAPEQIHGSHETDPRSDVWALGIMLYELLAGRLPFDVTDAPALFVAIATRDVPPLVEVCPEVVPDVARLVARCLRRAPEDRYPSALELARDLRHALAGTELEPTQKLSVRPPPPAIPQLEIPDLLLPTKRAQPAPKTLAGPPQSSGALGLKKTELSRLEDPPSAPSLEVKAARPAPAIAKPPEPLPVAAPALDRYGPNRPMDGVMLGPGSATTPQRRPPGAAAWESTPRPVVTQDLSFLVGIAVVGLTAIGATAVLTTFAHQPEGLQLVQLVTKPTPTITLVVHGGLALAGFVLTTRFVATGFKQWRGDVDGGRGSALFHAVLGGALFFAAIELARAAW